MQRYGTIGATMLRSEPHYNYRKKCERCGMHLTSKGASGQAGDGLSLCHSCRTTDKPWQAMTTGMSEFRWTTDEELAALEAEEDDDVVCATVEDATEEAA